MTERKRSAQESEQWRRVFLLLALFIACKSTDSARQGGADFKTVTPEKLESKFEDVAGICFQTQTVGKIILDFADPSIGFEPADGATNSTGRCVREIASNFVFSTRPNGKVEVTAPKQPMNGWAVADWVKLLALESLPLVETVIRQILSRN